MVADRPGAVVARFDRIARRLSLALDAAGRDSAFATPVSSLALERAVPANITPARHGDSGGSAFNSYGSRVELPMPANRTEDDQYAITQLQPIRQA